MATKDPLETRPRRVTATSEERCEEAYKAHFSGNTTSLTDWERACTHWGWEACWRYLEKQVVKEFIER